MEELLSDLQKNLDFLIEKSKEEPKENLDRELLKGQIDCFQQNILQMSKLCLNELSNFSSTFQSMSDNISATEGILSLCKEAPGQQISIEGTPVQPIPKVEEPPPTELKTDTIQLPTGDYVLNFSALDQIGQTVESIADGEEGMPLIREIKPGQETPTLWTRAQDYFVEDRKNGANIDPAQSTFVITYGINPSAYPKDGSQRSIILQSVSPRPSDATPEESA